MYVNEVIYFRFYFTLNFNEKLSIAFVLRRCISSILTSILCNLNSDLGPVGVQARPTN